MSPSHPDRELTRQQVENRLGRQAETILALWRDVPAPWVNDRCPRLFLRFLKVAGWNDRLAELANLAAGLADQAGAGETAEPKGEDDTGYLWQRLAALAADEQQRFAPVTFTREDDMSSQEIDEAIEKIDELDGYESDLAKWLDSGVGSAFLALRHPAGGDPGESLGHTQHMLAQLERAKAVVEAAQRELQAKLSAQAPPKGGQP